MWDQWPIQVGRGEARIRELRRKGERVLSVANNITGCGSLLQHFKRSSGLPQVTFRIRNVSSGYNDPAAFRWGADPWIAERHLLTDNDAEPGYRWSQARFSGPTTHSMVIAGAGAVKVRGSLGSYFSMAQGETMTEGIDRHHLRVEAGGANGHR